jgi:hypothetical protein
MTSGALRVRTAGTLEKENKVACTIGVYSIEAQKRWSS